MYGPVVVIAALTAVSSAHLIPPPSHVEFARRSQPTGDAPAPAITFKSAAAKQFLVKGSDIPDVQFKMGDSYAGLIPVAPGSDQKFSFWLFPATSKEAVNNLAFWTNGGPGCSSFEGAIQENGPISWQPGQARPTYNEHAWTQAASMLYVEQPIGTGYTQGKATAKNETDVAAAIFGFMQQFLKVFSEFKNKNFYMTGESYAGFYVNYAADYYHKHQKEIALPLVGTLLFDPTLSWVVLQQEIPVVPLVERWAPVFAFNNTFMNDLKARHEDCGFAEYIEKHLTYPPPKGPFEIPAAGTFESGSKNNNESCNLYHLVNQAAQLTHSGEFNVYHITETPPTPWSVLAFPGVSKQQWPHQSVTGSYFDRADVKKALHMPIDQPWYLCSGRAGVFPPSGKDNTLYAALSGTLQSVIEQNQRTVIGHGLADMILMATGTRLIIQNLTWNGDQGFQKQISTPFIVEGQGKMGQLRTERGFTYVEVELAGHEVPEYQPQAGLQMFQYLVGQRKTPSGAWPS